MNPENRNGCIGTLLFFVILIPACAIVVKLSHHIPDSVNRIAGIIALCAVLFLIVGFCYDARKEHLFRGPSAFHGGMSLIRDIWKWSQSNSSHGAEPPRNADTPREKSEETGDP